VGEALEQGRGAACLKPRGAADHEVLAQADRVDGVAFDRQRNARIGGDVAQLVLALIEVAGDDLVSVEADPDARDARAAVAARVTRWASDPDSISSRAA
jgi:hypothetical protein